MINSENKKNYKICSSSGFSLMEVLISVMILSTGIVGSFSLIASSMAQFSTASNKIIAANLAQDGIERVRNVRDTNWLQDKKKPHGNGNVSWDETIDGESDDQKFVKFSCVDGKIEEAVDAGAGIMLDDYDPANTEKMQIEECVSDSKCSLKKYTYAAGSRQCFSDDISSGDQKDSDDNIYIKTDYSNFYRLIHIKRLNAYSNKVAVTVKWNDRGGTHYFTAEEILYNWKETN